MKDATPDDNAPPPSGEAAPVTAPSSANLQVVPDLLEELLAAVAESETNLKQVAAALKLVKRNARDFTRQSRKSQRDQQAKLKELRSAKEAIAKLSVVGF